MENKKEVEVEEEQDLKQDEKVVAGGANLTNEPNATLFPSTFPSSTTYLGWDHGAAS